MPISKDRKIRMTIEFDISGSASDGLALDTASAGIEGITKVAIIPDGESEVQLRVGSPKIISKTIERR